MVNRISQELQRERAEIDGLGQHPTPVAEQARILNEQFRLMGLTGAAAVDVAPWCRPRIIFIPDEQFCPYFLKVNRVLDETGFPNWLIKSGERVSGR